MRVQSKLKSVLEVLLVLQLFLLAALAFSGTPTWVIFIPSLVLVSFVTLIAVSAIIVYITWLVLLTVFPRDVIITKIS